MERSDKVLLEAHCLGDADAFNEILRRYGSGLLGYLRRMVGNTDSAEDVFQETFMRVHEKAHTLKTDKFKTWLYTIATRLALDKFKKDKQIRFISLDAQSQSGSGNELLPSSLVAVDKSPGPPETAELAEQKENIRLAIERLPENQRITLLLAYYEKMNYSDVAQILGCSQNTVKTHMFRALKSLANILPEPAGGNQ